MNRKLLILLLLIVCQGTILKAQAKLTLDLAGARKYALEHNKTLQNSALANEKAQWGVKEAIANGLPQVNATMDYNNSLGANLSIQFNPGAPPVEIPIKPQSNLNLTLSQLVFNGNYILGVQTAKLYARMTEKNQRRSELEVVSQVTDAYYLVLMSKEMLNVLNQNVSNLEKLYQKIQAMEQVGMIEKTEVDQLSVQLNTLRNAVKSSERQNELATNMLRLMIGATVQTEIELTETLQGFMEGAALEGALLKNFDLSGNIDYQLLEQQELISQKMVDMKKAAYLPTLAAFYRFTYKIIEPAFDMSPPNVVGFQLNIPIFSSGVRKAQLKQAELDLKSMQNTRELLSDQLMVQEKQLRYNYTSALESWQNQKENVEVARRVYSSLKLKYEQGVISGLDLINADSNYLKAESDYLSSMMQVLSARVQLEKLYGTIL
ncbi:MAG TPA: TolC family protein [Bacteroidales bacterium]|nr:TolC family protein [Bacteroidales bacterium]HRZ48242.1 TolC family protein [Bacteroidales bacterium]